MGVKGEGTPQVRQEENDMHILLKRLEMQKLTVTFLNSNLNMNKETAYSYIKYTKITDLIYVGKFLYKIK